MLKIYKVQIKSFYFFGTKVINIGSKIKKLRKEQSITQTELAESVNLSYQQIQKYENGKSKINVNKLMEICKALNTEIGYFLYDYKEEVSSPKNHKNYNKINYNLTEEEKKLIKYFRQIKSPEIRKNLLKQIKGIIG